MFLRLVGIDSLEPKSHAHATEGIDNVEISLVLDISGSMRSNGRMANMRKAAISFATTVLDPKNGGTVSLNVVPYAGQTNPGQEMFSYLEGQRLSTDFDAFPMYSSCLEIGPGSLGGNADFANPGLPGTGRLQVPHFTNWRTSRSDMDWGWCPQEPARIQYARQVAGNQNTPGTLNHFISNIRMHDGTGTHYGMKYGLALLDPTSRGAFAHLNTVGQVPDDFADRPAPWDDSRTLKYIILMTDGAITQQYRPKDPLDPQNSETELNSRRQDRLRITKSRQNIASFYAVCDLAKDPARNVVVYTVAFEANSAARRQMADCASSPSHYFRTSGSELISVFDSIATQIGNLRLTR